MELPRVNEAAECWPSSFGPGDQLGMLNHITDATRAAALRLVRSGRLYDLGRVLDENVPTFPGRYFRQALVTTAHHANGGGIGANHVNWITEQVAGTQQHGTHLDATDVRACLLNLNGVLTCTQKVHAAAWKEMFDDYLRVRAEHSAEPFVPFDPVADYAEYVDGKPRYDGMRSKRYDAPNP